MMAETTYGVRKYTCSAKTKRPQKGSQNLEKLEKRNSGGGEEKDPAFSFSGSIYFK